MHFWQGIKITDKTVTHEIVVFWLRIHYGAAYLSILGEIQRTETFPIEAILAGAIAVFKVKVIVIIHISVSLAFYEVEEVHVKLKAILIEQIKEITIEVLKN